MNSKILLSIILFASPCIAQDLRTGNAAAKGSCSPAVTGSNNKFTLTCQGISEKLAQQISNLANRLAENQADAQMILTKLDACVASVNQIRENELPWKLQQAQKDTLAKALSGTKVMAQVHVLPNDRNSSLFGDDLQSLLKSLGWDLQPVTDDFALPSSLTGVHIIITHSDFPEAEKLLRGLVQAGIPVHGQVDNKNQWLRDPKSIFIAIGAKPSNSTQ